MPIRIKFNGSGSTRARLRLCAGSIVLKLCVKRLPNNVAVYETMFTSKSFNLVSLLPQVYLTGKYKSDYRMTVQKCAMDSSTLSERR